MVARATRYQYALIVLGIAVTALFALFIKREIYPEYKIYQKDYVALENFRSTYTHEPAPSFQMGIKQIVMERSDKGPATVDRCISCHVALEFSHFSPTKVAYNINGDLEIDAEGFPRQIPNENYVFAKLDAAIADLSDEKVNVSLKEKSERLALAHYYQGLKSAQVGEQSYDVTKVLRMHPLIGKETRPFEHHPIEQYGCVSCHGGNGRGLVTDRAHGPVFDGQYETEFQGHIPQFTESNENDPPFARFFNHKPGTRLLFQTTPILPGGLIEANCMACHLEGRKALQADKEEKLKLHKKWLPDVESSLATHKIFKELPSALDKSIPHFKQGQELFMAQACYACHRIAGWTRGGVGPELTREGFSYPWFVKESIVWPQADVHDSTMPNFQLDHEELESLVTFLLAQKGQPKSISDTDYQKAIQQWEAGKKREVEEPVTPVQRHDVRFAMKIFATEGCAACHRLKGFESDVGFSKEKEGNWELLYAERQWFKRLFPERIVGSELVKVLEKHGTEIDQHLLDNVRQGSILEEIELQAPGILESFYTPFKYASRAKNRSYADAPQKIKEWRRRLHRVLMAFIQEYGLGRLIGPKPNWTGIYRSDEWLMAHFYNPMAHVARSIMPVFPFDSSKFYALTHMLDLLAKKNSQSVHEIWQKKGFDPQEAYDMHCAQCHGEFLQGNGPVATWIYPIPKNLRNADFLRNLTRERVISSITHGIKGTPMPPWGEIAADKQESSSTPVLSPSQIDLLTDWIFSALPGAEVIKSSTDVPKWHYTPEAALKEMHQEGGGLGHTEEVNQVFDTIPNPISRGDDPQLYYINKAYFTEENLIEGRRLFEMNCAVCHGTEGDGSGPRASSMRDAKPRMFTNLDWINTHDDLRLLRSIKYGVAGTAMNPWGDLTSSLQRLQLVMFIRSLSHEARLRDQLTENLFNIYTPSISFIEKIRLLHYPELEKLNKESNFLNAQLQQLQEGAEKKAGEIYQLKMQVQKVLRRQESRDTLLQDLSKEIEREKMLYQNLALQILSQKNEQTFHALLEIVQMKPLIYQMEENHLVAEIDALKAQRAVELSDALGKQIQAQIEILKSKEVVVQGKIASSQRSEELSQLNNAVENLEKLRATLISTEAEAMRSRLRQKELVDLYSQLPTYVTMHH